MALGQNNVIQAANVTRDNIENSLVYRDSNGDFYCNFFTADVFKASGNDASLIANNGWKLVVTNSVLRVYNPQGAVRWQATATSNRIIKNNIHQLDEYDLKNFDKINPVSFYYKPQMNYADTSKRYGVIAEELLQVYPNLVSIPPEYDNAKFDITKGLHQPHITVKYEQFIPLLVKKIQMQQKKLQELREILQNKLNT